MNNAFTPNNRPSSVSNRNSEKKGNEISLEQYEAILLQQQHLQQQHSQQHILPYSVDDVRDTVYYLNALHQLEFDKKKKCLTLARPLIQTYLYNCYNCNLLDLFTNYDCVDHVLSGTIEFKNSDNRILTCNDYSTPSKSIRSHINYFLTFYKNFCLNNNPLANTYFVKNKTRLYIQLPQVPEFLMLFSYFDNRFFSKDALLNGCDRLPKFKKSGSDVQSYQKLIYRISTFADLNDKFFPKYSVLYNADRLFSCWKLNILISHYEQYTDDSFLSFLTRNYVLSYNEVLCLKDAIVKKIFEDDDFIKSGLKSNFPDFMLLFHIYFYFHSYIPSPEKRSMNDLLNNIDAAKQFALLQSEILSPYEPKQNILSQKEIIDKEKAITDFLEKNPFFTTYSMLIPDSAFMENHPMLKYFPTWDDLEEEFLSLPS